MPTFSFNALNPQGMKRDGTVDAVNKDAAQARLMEDGLTILLLEPLEEPKDVMKVFSHMKRIKSEVLVQFARQLATMIDAGIGILRALQVLESQADNPKFKKILTKVSADAQTGQQLSDALAKHPAVFDFSFVAMIRAGEKSGSLDDALLKLAQRLEGELRLKRAIKAATTYPKVVGIFSLLIISVLVNFIVPKFAKIFVDTVEGMPPPTSGPPLDASLPAPTQFVVDGSELIFPVGDKDMLWIGQVVLRILVLFAIIYFIKRLFRFALTKPRVRYRWDYMKLNFPMKIGPLVQKIAVARFARSFSTMIGAGIQPVEAMENVADVSGNSLIRDAILEAQRHILAGQTMAGPLERAKVFPTMLTQMIEIGEESGQLQLMLEKSADFYEEEVDMQIKGLTSLIEPLMIVVVGMAIGAIVIVTYLPMFKLYDLIG